MRAQGLHALDACAQTDMPRFKTLNAPQDVDYLMRTFHPEFSSGGHLAAEQAPGSAAQYPAARHLQQHAAGAQQALGSSWQACRRRRS